MKRIIAAALITALPATAGAFSFNLDVDERLFEDCDAFTKEATRAATWRVIYLRSGELDLERELSRIDYYVKRGKISPELQELQYQLRHIVHDIPDEEIGDTVDDEIDFLNAFRERAKLYCLGQANGVDT